jgi:FMN reductase
VRGPVTEPVRITVVLGSVTPPGRLRRALTEALARVDPAAAEVQLIDLAEVRVASADGTPPAQLTDDTPAVVTALADADAVLLATPIYRGSLTGVLKNLLDLTPISALRDTPVAIVAMGASDHHTLGAERHLRDVLAFFGALVLPTAVYLTSRDFADGVPSERAAAQLDAVVAATVTLAHGRRGAQPLGPPPLAASF